MHLIDLKRLSNEFSHITVKTGDKTQFTANSIIVITLFISFGIT